MAAPNRPRRTLLVAEGVHTLDERDTTARAVLVDGERIAWIGAEPADAPASDQRLDLAGAWITPSFVDAHVHATATGLSLTGLNLAGAESLAEALRRLAEHAATSTEPVVLGDGWDDFAWPEGRRPTAADVARVAPDRIVLLDRVDRHSCVVDPATLAGLPLPELDGVDRDASGNPTGWLRERAGAAARGKVLAQVSARRFQDARAAACRAAAALGIGSLHEMGVPGMYGLDDALVWMRGAWPVEVLVWWAELDPDRGPAHGLRPGGDLFLDGSIGSRTAAVSHGYADGGDGELFHDDEDVRAFFSACTADGRGAGVHAIGDRAIEQALSAIEAAAARHGSAAVRRCRHRIEHVELPTRGHVRRMAALGVVASVQPAFDATWGGDDQLYARCFGTEVSRRSNPLAWFDAERVIMAFGSDSTVTPLDPWGAVSAAERHRGGLGLSRRAALHAHTRGGRDVAGQDEVGPVAAGKRADLAVWSENPLAVEDPRGLDCLATVVQGRGVYGDLPLAATHDA